MSDPSRKRSIFFPLAAASSGRPCWQPKADVYSASGGWIVKFDLAGVGPEDIQVCYSGSRLTVSGVRRDWLKEEGTSYHSLEIAYSRFERCVDLPLDLESTRVESEYRDGMLVVRIQK